MVINIKFLALVNILTKINMDFVLKELILQKLYNLLKIIINNLNNNLSKVTLNHFHK